MLYPAFIRLAATHIFHQWNQAAKDRRVAQLSTRSYLDLSEPLIHMASYVNALGFLAALASMASFVPQAWKIIRTRETKDISAGMYFLTVAAFALWLGFGVLQRQWPLVVSNAVCLTLSLFILAMTLFRQTGKDRVAAALTGKSSRRNHN
jgi:MtN3 and saliva related transmembrane protein